LELSRMRRRAAEWTSGAPVDSEGQAWWPHPAGASGWVE